MWLLMLYPELKDYDSHNPNDRFSYFIAPAVENYIHSCLQASWGETTWMILMYMAHNYSALINTYGRLKYNNSSGKKGIAQRTAANMSPTTYGA